MALSWYVIRTKPQSDYIAADALRKEGYEHFFPRISAPPRRPGRREVPLFPGYMFVRCDTAQGWWPQVGALPGILGWLRYEGVVPPVPDDVVNELVQRVDSINQQGGLWTRFRRGQIVRIASGELEGLARLIDEPKSPKSRVRVLLEFMGQMVSVQVPWGDLQPAAESSIDDVRRGRRRTRGRGRWVRGMGPRSAVHA